MNIFNNYNLINSIRLDSLHSKNSEELAEGYLKIKNFCIYLDQIIENFPEGIVITDGQANTIKVNKAFEKIVGVSRENLIGKNLNAYSGVYVEKAKLPPIIKEKRSGVVKNLYTLTGTTCMITCTPVLDKNNEVIMIINTVRDMREIEHLKATISRKEELVSKYKSELETLKNRLFSKSEIIIQDEKMLNSLKNIEKIAQVDSTVLLLGETGVGKEEIAKYIHENSQRNNGKFIEINCAAIPENLFESELFGYEKGAFTGATAQGKTGLLEAADKGTIFLDEIGEMPLDMQAKLLKVLQEGEFKKVGGIKSIKVDIRIIAATNRNLKKMVQEKKFREDLYYRLNVIPLRILPLRERKGDIVPLANHFLEKLNKKYNFNKYFSANLINNMLEYNWPGNIRELKNMVERAVIMSSVDEITLEEMDLLKIQIKTTEASAAKIEGKTVPDKIMEKMSFTDKMDLNATIERIEYDFISKAYEKHRNIREAAAYLSMKKSTFADKFKYYREKYGEHSIYVS